VNREIRLALGLPVDESEPVVEKIGSAGVGRGGTASNTLRTIPMGNDAINESIRRQRAVMRGHASIADLLNL
jgi:hypothetical protein